MKSNFPEEMPISENDKYSSGDLIEFYNQEFLKKFKSKILEFKQKKIEVSNEFDYKTYQTQSISKHEKSESPFNSNTDSSINIANNLGFIKTGRMLDFDQKFEEYEISTNPYIKNKSREKIKLSKMKMTRSPEHEVLEKFKTDVSKQTSPKVTIETLKKQARSKIYQSSKNRTPDRTKQGRSLQQHSQNMIKISPDCSMVIQEKKYQSQCPPTKDKNPNSKYLANTYKILDKSLTNSDTSAFSYFAKKKFSGHQLMSGNSKPVSSNMTRMNRSGNNFYKRGFLKQNKISGRPNNLSNSKKTGNRFALTKFPGRNLYFKANMSKFKNISFSGQNKNAKHEGQVKQNPMFTMNRGTVDKNRMLDKNRTIEKNISMKKNMKRGRVTGKDHRGDFMNRTMDLSEKKSPNLHKYGLNKYSRKS